MVFAIAGRIIDRQNAARSVVNINGKYLRIGDTVDSKGHVKVSEIHSGHVVFHFKGEAIRRDVGKKSRKDGKGKSKKSS